MSEPGKDLTTQKSQEKQLSCSDPAKACHTTLNPTAKPPSATNTPTSSTTVTIGRSEMDEQEDPLSSRPGKSAEVAENGSVATSKEQVSTPETPGNEPSVKADAPQLCKWVYQTSHGDLTLAENLEKSKWEGGRCEGTKKTED